MKPLELETTEAAFSLSMPELMASMFLPFEVVTCSISVLFVLIRYDYVDCIRAMFGEAGGSGLPNLRCGTMDIPIRATLSGFVAGFVL
jgi:hypothetical protein